MKGDVRVSPFDEDERWRDVPVAELSDEEGCHRATRRVRAHRVARARGPRSRRVAAAFLAGSLLAAASVVAARVANRDDPAPPDTDRKVETISPDRARVDVLAALRATNASGSFRIHAQLSEAARLDVMITADSTINVDPTVLVATARFAGSEIHTRINGTDVWESGGANFGMTPGANEGPGAPLSQFASVVLGSLGQREGAVAMNSMASPTGYLDLAAQAITAASWRGDAVVDGVPVHEYRVEVDAAKVLERPGLTSEEITTATAAVAVLRAQGYTGTTVRMAIDDRGFIRHTVTTVRFADGDTVTADAHISDFGCATTVLTGSGPAIIANPAGCPSG